MEYVLQTFDIVKKYKNQLALNHVNMNIEKGDIYGFVGENGAGKTTIIRVLTNLVTPTSGTYNLFGVSSTSSQINKARSKMSAVVETPSIYLNMSAYDNLKMQSIILGINDDNKIHEVLDMVGLSYMEHEKKTAKNYSLGMKQRLGIAISLLGDPEFIVLDEPMNGLDPEGIVEVRELILRLNKEKGITFLISSHILTELQLVATKYGIISHGKMLKEITAAELTEECRTYTEINVSDMEHTTSTLKTLNINNFQVISNNVIRLFEEFDINNLIVELSKANVHVNSIGSKNSNIEDFYLSLIGGKHND